MTNFIHIALAFVGTPIFYFAIFIAVVLLICEHIANNEEKAHQREAVMRRLHARRRQERREG